MNGWTCPQCGDTMPPGYGEGDHFNCNWPEDFEGGSDNG